MSARDAGVILGAAIVALLLWPRDSAAQVPDDDLLSDPLPDWLFPPADSGASYEGADGDPYFPDDGGLMNAHEIAARNLSAFLYMIGCAETSQLDMDSGIAYRRFYGNSLFSNFADHPVLTGEKRGVPLSDEMCRNAGFGPGCVSTAAGAFQITRPTWEDVRKAGTWGPAITDFSPTSQQEAARRVLILCGALPYVMGGSFNRGLELASSRWASLPGSTAKQNPKSVERVLSFYNQGLRLFDEA